MIRKMTKKDFNVIIQRAKALNKAGETCLGWLAHAVLKKVPAYFESFGIAFFYQIDDLDEYAEADLWLTPDDGPKFPFAFKRYQGHPPGTMNIMFPDWYSMEERTRMTMQILNEFSLDETDLEWIRKEGDGY